MRGKGQALLLTVLIVLCTALTARADSQTFAELLARAKAQAVAGLRSAPPGDNMIETIAGMVDLASTATPAELEELVTLLEGDKPSPKEAPAMLTQDQAPLTAPPKSSFASLPPAATTPSTMAAPSVPASPVSANPAPASPVPTSPVATSPAPANPMSASPVPANPMSASPVPASPAPDMPAVPKATQALSGQALADASARAATLFKRGQAAEATGDISGARRLYKSAAEHGNATAARCLGRLYDPAFLRLTTVGGVDPDPALARFWYEYAAKLGDSNTGSVPDAVSLLKALSAR